MDTKQNWIYKRTCYYYNWILNSNHGQYAKQYLENRGISLKVANNFLLGSTLPNKNGNYYTNNLILELSKHSDIIDIINSRLTTTKIIENKIELFDYFTLGRIILPVIQNQSPVYFTSRSVDSNEKNRFMNIKHVKLTGIFNQDILNSTTEEVYITEGIMDALSLESIGKSTISTLGTAGIRPEHRPIFEGKNKKYIFVFDSDANGAGEKAVLKSASVLKSFGIDSIYKIVLPRKEDQKKVDINQLLIRAKSTDRLREWFDGRIRQIIHVEAHQPKIGNSSYNSQKVEIIKVVSRFVSLQQLSTTLFRCKCPFHNETNPSFYVYTETGTFKCFGCGKWGDASQFLQDLHGISFIEAQNKIKNEFS